MNVHQISLWDFTEFPSWWIIYSVLWIIAIFRCGMLNWIFDYELALIINFQFQKVAATTELGGKSVKNAFKAINIGSYQEIFPSFYPLQMMDRSGLDQMTDTSGLCLQDLVGSGSANNNNTSNGNIPTSQSNSNDHLHNHHHHHNLHDGTSVSVSSAISNLMSPSSVGSIGSGLSTGLSHLHHSSHPDLSGHHHHHHITSPHTPSVLHEPLEKLKCESINIFCVINHPPNKSDWTRFVSIIKSSIHKSDQICFKQTNRFVTLNIQFVADEPLSVCSRSSSSGNSSSARKRDVEMISQRLENFCITQWKGKRVIN